MKNEFKTADEGNLTKMFFSGGTPVKEAAGFIVKSYFKNHRELQFRAVGASAICQMYKAMATASAIFAQHGLVARFRPGYDTTTVERDGKEKEITVMVGYMDIS